ncbi:MAG TPA: molybdenum cofactor guanylyltransferase [Vicinamibacterales bacterium]|nr:molybdenum cofactor guanylyltransferase [Vicinamibacterales bacterium]
MVAAILAGGHARRLGGRDKSQLTIDGRTILERQVDALAGLVDRVWLVGYRGPATPALPATILLDRTADRGPLGGLDAALAAADGDNVLLLACDMPNVTGPMLEYLIRQLPGADVVAPRTERGYHPLCAVYAPACRLAVQRRLQSGSLRARDLLDDLEVRAVDAAELARFGEVDHLLANVNTQADLDALESQQNH